MSLFRRQAAVRDLYGRLSKDGFDPWLDTEKLLPGQDWDFEITKAVRASDVVVVCLSQRSITKEGYVNREIKQALDVADEKPEGMIFLIPLRLEECNVPHRLRRWHWVDLYDDQGYEKLIQALRLRDVSNQGKDDTHSRIGLSKLSSEHDIPAVPGLAHNPYVPGVILRASRAVPAVRWALGVVAIVSAAGLIVVGLEIGPLASILGFVVMTLAMAILLIFAHAVRGTAETGRLVSTVFIRSSLVLFTAGVTTVFVAATTNKPLPLRKWLTKHIGHSETVINFASEDTTGPPFWVPADGYLRRFGISISDVTENSKVVLQGDYVGGGSAFVTPSHNALTQLECHGPVGFTLRFDKPVSRVSFTRAGLIAGTPNGITHPAWSVCVFNRDQRLGCKGEHILREFANVPERDFSLQGPDITSVRVESDFRLDGKPFTAFCAVLIQSVTLTQ